MILSDGETDGDDFWLPGFMCCILSLSSSILLPSGMSLIQEVVLTPGSKFEVVGH